MEKLRQLLMPKVLLLENSVVPFHPVHKPASLIVGSSTGFIMILPFKLGAGIPSFIAFVLLCFTDVCLFGLSTNWGQGPPPAKRFRLALLWESGVEPAISLGYACSYSYVTETLTSGTIIRFFCFGHEFEEELKNAYVMDILLNRVLPIWLPPPHPHQVPLLRVALPLLARLRILIAVN